MTPGEEQAWEDGRRAAYRALLRTVLKELGYEDPEARAARWVVEREDAIATLRSICRDHGDNEWENNLHLSDILEKHLQEYLDD